jgi:hypothetical protein
MKIQSLEARAAELRKLLPNDEQWISVYCNGCGRIEGARNVLKLLPSVKGWQISREMGGKDLCPACREEEAGWAGSFPKRRTG